MTLRRPTSLADASPRLKKATAAKLQILDQVQEECYPQSVVHNPERKKRRRAALRALSVEFYRLMKKGVVIVDILAKDWALQTKQILPERSSGWM